MLKVSVLTSGSKGNSTLVQTDQTVVLFDAGITYKRTAEMLEELRINPLHIDAIVISHEHTDHVGGAGVLSRKLKIPIYITQQTFGRSAHKVGKLPIEPVYFDVGEPFQIKNMVINSFTSPHDAIESCNFIVYNEDIAERRLAIATDLGYAPQLLLNKLKTATTIVLESNHDLTMLMEGPYEWNLKQRIKSKLGHLSNVQASEIVSTIYSEDLDRLILAHLSEQNNHPQLALDNMKQTLQLIKAKTELNIASQITATPLFDV